MVTVFGFVVSTGADVGCPTRTSLDGEPVGVLVLTLIENGLCVTDTTGSVVGRILGDINGAWVIDNTAGGCVFDTNCG